MKSPCNKVCVMDPQTGFCRGCFRTLDEIAGWGSFSDEDREKILSILEERKTLASNIRKISVPPLP